MDIYEQVMELVLFTSVSAVLIALLLGVFIWLAVVSIRKYKDECKKYKEKK